MTTTNTLNTPEVDIVYDVHGPLPTTDGRPPLVMIGQPMTAGGFDALAAQFADRTVVTYDPRGLGRSVRKDGRVDQSPLVQATDVHAVIEAPRRRPGRDVRQQRRRRRQRSRSWRPIPTTWSRSWRTSLR